MDTRSGDKFRGNLHQLPRTQISRAFAGLKVAGLVADRAACGHYRVVNPLHMLWQHGAEVDYGISLPVETLLRVDHVVAPRQNNPEILEQLVACQWEDVAMWYEIDDDLDAVLPSSPAYAAYHTGSAELTWTHRYMEQAHGITTTTQEIARAYSRFNTNIGILENYIDLSYRDWNYEVEWVDGARAVIKPLPQRKPEEWKGKRVIAWQGGSTHWDDLQAIGPAIKGILENREDVLFAFYGATGLMEPLVEKFKLPRDKVVNIEPRPFGEHPTGMHGIDIQLAPIVCCQFNLCKSHLKVLEGMAAGSAVVASHVGPYARFSKRHPGSFITVGKGGDFGGWGEAITYLLDRPELLDNLKAAGRKLVVDHYSLERNFQLWPKTWAAMRKKAFTGDYGPPAQLKPSEFYRSYSKAGRNDPCPCGSGKKYKNCCRGAFG